MFLFPRRNAFISIFMLENVDKRTPWICWVKERKPSDGTYSSVESQNIDTEKSLMSTVEITFICSFCLV